MDLADVIVAISSPPGRSPRGMVRASGPLAAAGVTEIVTLRDWADDTPAGTARKLPPRGTYRAQIDLGAVACPALALVSRAPRSYTGEDSIELLVPGHPALLERIVARLTERPGVRRAEAGEFTARAYFNERLSLSQAEGVAATIAAHSDAELRAARLLATDALGTLAARAAHDLARTLALVEAGIDFVDEEDVVAIEPAALDDALAALRRDLGAVLDRAVGMEQIEAVPWVVLTGAANAGKSTLFNALLERDRAIVSATAGTTRDVLVEPLRVPTPHGAADVLLVDVAGIEAIDGALADAMRAARQHALARAELILDCQAADAAPADREHDHARNADTARCPVLTVRTKSDLAPARASDDAETISVCAHSGAGLDAVRAAIAERLADRAVALGGDLLVMRPRHEAALRSGLAHLDDARALVADARSRSARQLADAEFVAAALRLALDDLGLVAGTITPDDVLGHVFASFCVGK